MNECGSQQFVKSYRRLSGTLGAQFNEKFLCSDKFISMAEAARDALRHAMLRCARNWRAAAKHFDVLLELSLPDAEAI
jgi:hypothetical protein